MAKTSILTDLRNDWDLSLQIGRIIAFDGLNKNINFDQKIVTPQSCITLTLTLTLTLRDRVYERKSVIPK